MKAYLGEGVVHEQKLLVVDPDELRDRAHWLRFLPAVYKVKDAVEEESKASNLKVAWRYNTLLDEIPSDTTTNNKYRFDNSREMGSTFANSMSQQLNKDGCLLHMRFGESFVSLWE